MKLCWLTQESVSWYVSGEQLNYHQQRRGSLSGSSQGGKRESSSDLIKILATSAGTQPVQEEDYFYSKPRKSHVSDYISFNKSEIMNQCKSLKSTFG